MHLPIRAMIAAFILLIALPASALAPPQPAGSIASARAQLESLEAPLGEEEDEDGGSVLDYLERAWSPVIERQQWSWLDPSLWIEQVWRPRRRARFRISSRFGPRFHPVLRRPRLHNGVDFAAPRGTPIRAALSGTVRFVGRYGASGNLIILDHDRGYSTSYAHMSAFEPGLKAGDTVEAGDRIGKVGTTGRSTGPHLHFVLREKGRAVDPLAPHEGAPIVSPIAELATQLDYALVVRPMLRELGLA